MMAHGCIRMAYNKINGLLTYSQGDDTNGASITAHAYHGKWNSSDQIPVAAQSLVGFFGTLNPSDGGHSQRYSLQGEWHHQDANSESKIMAAVWYYDLDLFSDFTYYLVDYNKEDQFNQQDRRWVGYVDAHHTVFSTWFGPQDVQYVRRAVPQRLDQQRPLPNGKSCAHDQDRLLCHRRQFLPRRQHCWSQLHRFGSEYSSYPYRDIAYWHHQRHRCRNRRRHHRLFLCSHRLHV